MSTDPLVRDLLDRVVAGAAGAAGRVAVLAGVLGSVADPASELRALLDDPAGTPAALVLDVANATELSAVLEAVSDSAGRPGPEGGAPVRRYGLAGVTELLESTGWVVGEVHRVPGPAAGAVPDRAGTDPAVRAALEVLAGSGARSTATGADRDTAAFVVLARPAREAATLAALRARCSELEGAAVDAAGSAAVTARAWADRVETLTRRLTEAAELSTAERERNASLVTAGAAELDALRASLAEVRRELQGRSAELARERALVRAARSAREFTTGARVLRATEPVLAARRSVLRRVRPVLRRLR